MPQPAVSFESISKAFPGVVALSDISVDIAAGSCHALCGENGAGKSTLAKVLAGIHPADSGRVLLFGEELRDSSPRAALSAGVGMVHQELSFCENLSVAENLCLAALPTRRGLLARSEMEERAREMLATIGADLNVQRPIEDLTIGQQQIVQIAGAVGAGARVIIFDEPTSSLSQPEAERLYRLIGRLTARGITCIYVSHRMPEIFALCDAVTILRDGHHVLTAPIGDLTEATLVQLMIGRSLTEYIPNHRAMGGAEEVLRVENLSSPGKFSDVSFSLRAGEVLGLAGLVGAGRSDIAAALFGLQPGVQGRIFMFGQPVEIRSPRQAIRLGLGLVPEDRKRQGLVLSLSGVHNTSLPILRRLSRLTWVRQDKERALANEYFDRLRVRATGREGPVASLSGGNQQKIVLARWLAARCRVLILDEPTRGVDVGAKAEIHGLIDELAARGAAVLLISSELPEIIGLSSRMLVVREGRIVGELGHAEATQDRLLRMMAGLESSAPDPDRRDPEHARTA